MIGEKIRKLRQQNNETLEELAKELNTTHTTISRYETGKRKIDIETLKEICVKYNISADYILGLPKNLEYPEE